MTGRWTRIKGNPKQHSAGTFSEKNVFIDLYYDIIKNYLRLLELWHNSWANWFPLGADPELLLLKYWNQLNVINSYQNIDNSGIYHIDVTCAG